MTTAASHRNRGILPTVLITAAVGVSPYLAVAQVSDICVPQIQDVLGNGPAMNGNPQGDAGWGNAGDLPLGEHTMPAGGPASQKSGDLQYGVHNGNFYFSVALDYSSFSVTNTTTVIVVLSPKHRK